MSIGDIIKNCEYARIATHTDLNPINWGDAEGFFMEGMEYQRRLQESQLAANSNMVLVEDERHDQLLTAEARVAEYERILADPASVWANMLTGKIARPQALDHYEECKAMVAAWEFHCGGFGGTPEAVGQFICAQQDRIRHCQDLDEQVRVLRGALVEVKQVLSCSMRSATEENCLDGPWLPAGVCCKIYDALAATEGLDNEKVSHADR